MLSSLIKLAAAGVAILGPFMAGAALGIVRNPEALAFFVIAGVFLGALGLFGFAALDRDEAAGHARRLSGREG